MDDSNRTGAGRTIARAARCARRDLPASDRRRLATESATARYIRFLRDELQLLPALHPLRDEYAAQLTDLARRIS